MTSRRSIACFVLMVMGGLALAAEEGENRPGEVAVAFGQDNDGGWQNPIGMTDRWYTHGIALSFAHTPAPAHSTATRHSGRRRVAKPDVVVYTAHHAMYTPEDLTVARPPADARRYAGVAALTVSALARRAGGEEMVELSVGALGPIVAAGEIQRFAHRNWGGAEPQGWNTQIDTRPLVQLALSRAWPLPLAPAPSGTGAFATVQPELGLTAGTVSGSARAAVGATVGLTRGGVRTLESADGARSLASLLAHSGSRASGITVALSGGAAARAVAWDLLASGERTGEGPVLVPLVGEAWARLSLTVGVSRWWLAARYDQRWRSAEIESQRAVHRFASAMVVIGFRR